MKGCVIIISVSLVQLAGWSSGGSKPSLTVSLHPQHSQTVGRTQHTTTVLSPLPGVPLQVQLQVIGGDLPPREHLAIRVVLCTACLQSGRPTNMMMIERVNIYIKTLPIRLLKRYTSSWSKWPDIKHQTVLSRREYLTGGELFK